MGHQCPGVRGTDAPLVLPKTWRIKEAGNARVNDKIEVPKSLTVSSYARALKQVTEPLEDLSALSCGKVTELSRLPSSSMKVKGETLMNATRRELSQAALCKYNYV